MSYKIVGCALMNHINKGCAINVPSSPSLTPSSQAMSAPQRLTPDRLPDPWVLDTESLLSELARVRSLALQIPPARNDILGPTNSVIDALWDLEERLRYCFHLHCEAQRSFAKKHANGLLANQIPKQHRPFASRTATVRRRHFQKNTSQPKILFSKPTRRNTTEHSRPSKTVSLVPADAWHARLPSFKLTFRLSRGISDSSRFLPSVVCSPIQTRISRQIKRFQTLGSAVDGSPALSPEVSAGVLLLHSQKDSHHN